jgi:N-acetylglucosamine-6-phosphate deacetylase
MPSTIHSVTMAPRVTKLTNCRLVKGRQLIKQDLWIDAKSGKILQDQQAFYDHHITPNQVVDLGGRILAPGFIETQLNGAQGFDFSEPQATTAKYDAGLKLVNRELVKTGVTSYLPTVTSQLDDVYHKVSLLLNKARYIDIDTNSIRSSHP